jgi:hypothetical protein
MSKRGFWVLMGGLLKPGFNTGEPIIKQVPHGEQFYFHLTYIFNLNFSKPESGKRGRLYRIEGVVRLKNSIEPLAKWLYCHPERSEGS